MTGWLDALIQGVLLGGLYALFATGLSLIFGVMRLVNLAHGDLIVLAAYAILFLAERLGLDPFGAAIVAIVVLNLIFYQTPLGRAFRATSDDFEVAQLMGIDHSRIFATAMGLAF